MLLLLHNPLMYYLTTRSRQTSNAPSPVHTSSSSSSSSMHHHISPPPVAVVAAAATVNIPPSAPVKCQDENPMDTSVIWFLKHTEFKTIVLLFYLQYFESGDFGVCIISLCYIHFRKQNMDDLSPEDVNQKLQTLKDEKLCKVSLSNQSFMFHAFLILVLHRVCNLQKKSPLSNCFTGYSPSWYIAASNEACYDNMICCNADASISCFILVKSSVHCGAFMCFLVKF